MKNGSANFFSSFFFKSSCVSCALTGAAGPEGRLAGSLAAAAVAVLHGAALVRTHDVAETRDAVRVAEQIRKASVR